MTFRPLAPVLSATVALALSACAGMSLDEPSSPPRQPVATSRPAPIVAPPPPRPAAKAPAELSVLRPSPRPAGERESASPAGPPKLVGLSEEETVGLLGRPAEENEQAPGKVWIYRAAGCQLSVHLYPDMEKGGFYALDYAADGGRDACLGKVAGEARKRGGALSESARAG
jgi:hypothetical protein